MDKKSEFSQLGVGVLEEFEEKWVPCPNPECDGEVEAQRIIAFCPRSGAEGRHERTDCCGLDREEIFELVDPDDDEDDSEPMEDAYQFEVDA